MNIYKLIGRNLEITDAIRDYVEKKLARLDRYQDGELMAKVVLSLAGSPTWRRRPGRRSRWTSRAASCAWRRRTPTSTPP